MPNRNLDLPRLLSACLWGPVWLLLLHPWWRRRARSKGLEPLWVIGGHRGRLYGDNSRAVEREARRRGIRIVWIANGSSADAIARAGPRVLIRHSFAARRAISQARVLVYSHGEDDLDVLLIGLRGRTALRCYLNHCLNLLKAGGVHEPGWTQRTWLSRMFRRWLITDCDLFLCASERERENFALSYPMHQGKFRLGGGAHLDDFAREQAEPARRIVWFPTFRESKEARARLEQTIHEVVHHPELSAWLSARNYELLIGQHVNTGTVAREYPAPFGSAPPSELAEALGRSEILISDYSGVIFDYLLYERAPILFAFDLHDYRRGRRVYQDYDAIDYAVHARTVEELVSAICQEKTKSPDLGPRVKLARERFLPRGCGFAAQSVDAILSALDDPPQGPCAFRGGRRS